jgi:hypothetical protein
MAENKYGKYIITELKKDIQLPGFRSGERGMLGQGEVDGKRRFMEHVFWLDGEVIPGAFYGEAVWFWPQAMEGMPRPPIREITPEEAEKNPVLAPHSHPFPEILSYFGTDVNNPSDLGGEIEFWLEDEQYIFDKSFVVYIPAGVKHCPLRSRRMDRPMFHFTMGPGEMYR